MELRSATTDKRVRGKDKDKDSTRPLDGSPLRRAEREETDAAAVIEGGHRLRASAEAKGTEEQDQDDASGPSQLKFGSDVDEQSEGFEDAGSMFEQEVEEPVEYWNDKMSKAWEHLLSICIVTASFIYLLGIICLPSIPVPQHAASAAHAAELTKLRAITFTVDQVIQAIPEIPSRRMSANLMINVCALYDKATGGNGNLANLLTFTWCYCRDELKSHGSIRCTTIR